MTSDNILLALDLLPPALFNTLYMVIAASFFAILLGLPIGVILYLTGKGQIKENRVVYKTLGLIVNVGRSFPLEQPLPLSLCQWQRHPSLLALWKRR